MHIGGRAAIAVLGIFTYRLYRATAGLKESTDKLWDAGERQMQVIKKNAALQSLDMRDSINVAHQAMLLGTRDALRREVAAIDDLYAQVVQLSEAIGTIRLRGALDEDMDRLERVRLLMVDTTTDILRSARLVGIDVPSSDYNVIANFCNIALEWSNAAGKISLLKKGEMSAGANRMSGQLDSLISDAEDIRERKTQSALAAYRVIDAQARPFRDRLAKLTATMLEQSLDGGRAGTRSS